MPLLQVPLFCMKAFDNAVHFEDNHWIVVEKQPGWVCHADGNHPCLQEAVRTWLIARDNKPGTRFLHPIQRIDAPVSGLVWFAKTSKGLSRGGLRLRTRSVQRGYCACVAGCVEGSGLWCDCHPRGTASLHYRVLYQEGGYSWLWITLQTGYKRQIRWQCAERGYPIVGDTRFGAHDTFEGIMLHHAWWATQNAIESTFVYAHAKPPWLQGAVASIYDDLLGSLLCAIPKHKNGSTNGQTAFA